MESVEHRSTDRPPSPPYATVTGTTRYRARFTHLAADHYRLRYGLWLSSIGLGSYLPPGAGDAQPIDLFEHLPDEDPPAATTSSAGNHTPDSHAGGDSHENSGGYIEAVKQALLLGCNVLDTAANYRNGASEQEIGAAVRALIDAGRIRRDEVVICTKGGYLDSPNADDPNAEVDGRLTQEADRLKQQGLATGAEIVGGAHCIAPEYLHERIGASLDNLGLDAIDVYYLHNPEAQLQAVGPQEFKQRIRRAFEQLEQEAADKRIRLYGVATWDGLRTEPQARTYLPLTLLEEIAREVGGEKHRFRFIQFPYNALERTAFTARNQPLPGRTEPDREARSEERDDGRGEPVFGPLLAAAIQLGLTAVTSATLAQRRLLDRLPAQFARALGEWDTRAQAAIQFNRSTPGVTTTLVGMGTPAHVIENMAVAGHDPLPQERFMRLFQRPQSN